jgi:hypothetical protein
MLPRYLYRTTGLANNGDQRAFLSTHYVDHLCISKNTRSLSLATTAISYGKHGDMCGLNATNPLERTYTSTLFAFSRQLCARRNKATPNRSQDGFQRLGVRRAADLRKA